MPLDAQLLQILACPDEKGPLFYFEADSFLFCPACRRRYAIHDDIPDMLLDEATQLSEADAAALVDRAGREGLEPTFALDQ